MTAQHEAERSEPPASHGPDIHRPLSVMDEIKHLLFGDTVSDLGVRIRQLEDQLEADRGALVGLSERLGGLTRRALSKAREGAAGEEPAASVEGESGPAQAEPGTESCAHSALAEVQLRLFERLEALEVTVAAQGQVQLERNRELEALDAAQRQLQIELEDRVGALERELGERQEAAIAALQEQVAGLAAQLQASGEREAASRSALLRALAALEEREAAGRAALSEALAAFGRSGGDDLGA